MLEIDFDSDDFPRHVTTGWPRFKLQITWDDILWAAVTLGRPNWHHVFAHGEASLYEAMFRWSAIRLSLEQLGPRARRLRKTDAFRNLDPTEKGALNYFLGMTFCKVFAEKLLNTPWLLHLDIWRDQLGIGSLGRSRPDLVGMQTDTSAWHAFECKGRSSKPSQDDKDKAKAQARRVQRVAGVKCSLHVATFSFYRGDVLEFYWRDPVPEDPKSLDLPQFPGMWSHYYAPFYSAWLRASSRSPQASDGLAYTVEGLDIEIGIHPKILAALSVAAWDEAHALAITLHDDLVKDGYRPDGLKLRCGATWAKPFEENALYRGSRDGEPPIVTGIER